MNVEINLNDPFNNKGTAFDNSEREKFGLVGKMPSIVLTLEEQVELEYLKIQKLSDAYHKSLYLQNLYRSNCTLYFALIRHYIEQLLPIIYTPTIAENVIRFSDNYFGNCEAMYLDSRYPEKIEEAIINVTKNMDTLDLMVITDGEGILGIGDWGINGVEISIGKSRVYTVAAGIDPRRILPVIIDNGTNRKELLGAPSYLGKKETRTQGETYLKFIDKFVEVANHLYPNVLFHWEDFGRDNAQTILDRYKDKVVTFNDDIQGTGVTVVAAVNGALALKKESYKEQMFVIFGAGTAGIGIAEQITNDMIVQGLSKRAAKERIFMVDKNGVVTKENYLTEGQKNFARNESKNFKGLESLNQIIDEIKPSFLIGASGQKDAFEEKVVESMLKYHEHPAIFPLSNPSRLSEANAKNILHWSKGKALVVTGSPSDPVIINGVKHTIGQANNALFYPGLGLGIVASKATKVTDRMLSVAAKTGTNINKPDKAGDSLLPEIMDLRRCSLSVASAVFEAAIKDGVTNYQYQDIEKQINKCVWKACYSNE
ncbi:oxaloacetate-decarboxylating malate dehydrogenase [Enterococcus hulanensis]|uniref:oxaloacetate-decarboxylating malate dehydrogenase n=1 Tax=Enterococcus hulanensis TaxID=2559929 RepID=UPI0028BF1032|nr:oxaloacetate-decarboxylating malate dehydrogenase [Enterococcus hulanensis]